MLHSRSSKIHYYFSVEKTNNNKHNHGRYTIQRSINLFVLNTMTSPRTRFSSSPRNNRLKNIILCKLPSWLVCFLSGCIVGHWHGRYYYSNNVDHRMREKHSSELSLLPSLFSSSVFTNNCSTSSNVDNGWRQIDVFYGTSPTSNQTWFSQAAQDELVIGLLRGKRDGYFIDLAANDALLLSNTYAMEQRYGWYVLGGRLFFIF